MPSIVQMMRCGESSEVIEAIKMVVICREFAIIGSDIAVRELCRLVWKKDNIIKEAVVNACRLMFLVTIGEEYVICYLL